MRPDPRLGTLGAMPVHMQSGEEHDSGDHDSGYQQRSYRRDESTRALTDGAGSTRIMREVAAGPTLCPVEGSPHGARVSDAALLPAQEEGDCSRLWLL